MIVYCLIEYDYDGSSILSIHSEIRSAQTAAELHWGKAEPGGERLRWKSPDENGRRYSEPGCYVIEPHEVQP